jgi:hypothetical protein
MSLSMSQSRVLKVVSAILLGLATLVLLGCFLLWFSVGTDYHANAMRGQLGPSLLWLFALLAILNLAWAIRLAFRTPIDRDKKHVLIGWAVLAIVAATPILTQDISTGYHVRFFIADQEYSIPWQYNPINGKSEPGGTYFVIHVSHPDLIGQYSAGDKYGDSQLTVSRNVRDSRNRSESFVDLDSCTGAACTLGGMKNNAFFTDGEFLYFVHHQGVRTRRLSFESQEELAALKASLVSLFDSFKVD